MVADLEDAPEKVHEKNKKRVKFFAAITKKLKLITISDNVSGFLDESENDEADEALEIIRVSWRNLEMRRIKSNLESLNYRLPDKDYVSLVLDGGRIENVCVMTRLSKLTT